MAAALGIDVGTTAVKAVVLDDAGRVLAGASAGHDVAAPHPGWAEGDPCAWWAGQVVSGAASAAAALAASRPRRRCSPPARR